MLYIWGGYVRSVSAPRGKSILPRIRIIASEKSPEPETSLRVCYHCGTSSTIPRRFQHLPQTHHRLRSIYRCCGQAAQKSRAVWRKRLRRRHIMCRVPDRYNHVRDLHYGCVTERLMVTVLNTVSAEAFKGSNPFAIAIFLS